MSVNRRLKSRLGRAASIVCVGMVHLQSLLVTASDFVRRSVWRKIKRFEGFCFQHFKFGGLKGSFGCLALCSAFSRIERLRGPGAN